MGFLFLTGFFTDLSFKEPEDGIWILPQNMEDVNFALLKNNGIDNIYLHSSAVDEYGKEEIESWVQSASMYGLKVHIWVPVFYEDGSWVEVEDKDGNVNQKFIDKKLDEISDYARIRGISGIQLDYLRFPGGADNYPNPNEPLNDFAHEAHNRIKSIKPSLELSITLMPETYFTLLKDYNDYGQDYRELSSVADTVVVMMYKNNYNQDATWIKDTTEWFTSNSRGAQVIVGLQTYESESNPKPLSEAELINDIKAAFEGGAQGVSFFRSGLLNLSNVTSLQ